MNPSGNPFGPPVSRRLTNFGNQSSRQLQSQRSSSLHVEGTSGSIVGDEVHIHSYVDQSDDSDVEDSQELDHLKERAVLLLKQVDSDLYVPTRATTAAASTLEKWGVVFIEGSSRCGKTSMAHFLLKNFFDDRYTPIVLVSPQEWDYVPRDKSFLILVDDIFGRSCFSEFLLYRWIHLFKGMWTALKEGRVYFIFTSKSFSAMYSICPVSQVLNPLFNETHVISLQSKPMTLRTFAKYEILSNHLKKFHIMMDENDKEYIAEMSPTLGFPQCCTLFAASRYAQAIGSNFFISPQEILQEEISRMAERDKISYFVLVIIMMNDGEIHEKDLDINRIFDDEVSYFKQIQSACGLCGEVSFTDILNSAQIICGTFLDFKEGKFKFSHQSVWDAVCLVFSKVHLETVIHICSMKFLVQYTITEGCNQREGETRVVVPQRLTNTLCERIAKAMDTDNFRLAIQHKSLSDTDFLKLFIPKFLLLIRNCNVLQKKSKRRLPLHSSEEWYILSWAILGDHKALTKAILTTDGLELASDSYMIRQACEATCHAGDIETFELLLGKGCKATFWNLKTACSSYKSEEITNRLLHIIDLPSVHISELKPLVNELVKKQKVLAFQTTIGLLKGRSDKDELFEEALRTACKCGHHSVYSILQPIVKTSPNKLIHLAAKGGNTDILADVLKLGADLEHRAHDKNNNTPFLTACQYGRLSALKFLASEGADVLATNRYMENGLHLCVRVVKDESIVEYFITLGLVINARSANGTEPLHSSSGAGNVAITRALLDRHVDPSARDNEGNTPLHVTIMSLFPKKKIIQLLLSNGADITAENNRGENVLHLMTSKDGIIQLKFLLDNKAPIFACDANGQAPLHRMARESGCHDLVELLLEKGADVLTTDEKEQTPLHVASAVTENSETVKLLLDKGASALVQDQSGSTPLHAALTMYEEDTTMMQFSMHPSPNPMDMFKFHNKSRRPLKIPILDRTNTAKTITESKANLSLKDKKSRTSLHVAAASVKHSDVTNTLCDNGADVTTVDNDGQTPLLAAALSGHPLSVNFLLNHGSVISAVDKMGKTALHKAAEWGPGCEPDTASILFYFTVHGTTLSAIDILLDRGANANARDNASQTALHRAAECMPHYSTCLSRK